MSSRLAAVALCAPALLLAACDSTVNRGIESVHQPVVSHSDYAVDLATTPYGLAEGEASRLAGWMSALQPGYGDRIAIDESGGGSGARAQIAAEVARYGLLLADGMPVTQGAVTPGTVRVVLSRATASVPNCPRDDPYDAYTIDAHTNANYGCAINTNLAAMVANSDDLVRGQTGSGLADTITATKAIDAHRKAAPSGGGGTQLLSPGGVRGMAGN
ncbi:CpaD family pilus assembly lipoprotein [Sphingomonas sp. ac-8]|uniref:CpaD family pilus assembly lipoprotein n=1 Tax=Sphingomonas sp. ac-8 TaxID=3242977 RepID=UPI003A8122D3